MLLLLPKLFLEVEGPGIGSVVVLLFTFVLFNQTFKFVVLFCLVLFVFCLVLVVFKLPAVLFILIVAFVLFSVAASKEKKTAIKDV